MLRFILNKDNRFHLDTSSFAKVKWLNVSKRNDYLALSLMYNVFHKIAPSYLCNFTRIEEVHDHVTRYSRMSFVLPKVKSNGASSFSFCGIKLWNSLPLNIKSLDEKDKFKVSCKLHLFNQMVSSEQSQYA